MTYSVLRTSSRAIFTLLLTAVALALPAQPASAATYSTCYVFFFIEAECGRYAMPADRTGAVAGTTTVSVAKIRASEGPRLGTLFLMSGGPGQASTEMLAYMLALFPGANRYDMYAIDQRGTGESEPLNCMPIQYGAEVGGRDPARDRVLNLCATSLGPARAGYDTAEAVADMETVRADIGADQIALFGVSYGTKLAMAYAKTHPSRVKLMLLDSLVPTETPTAFDTASVAAMRDALDQVCANDRCRGILRSPQSGLRRLTSMLEAEPITTYVTDPNSGKPRKVTVGAEELFDLMFAADFNMFIHSQLPSAIDAALRGEVAPLLRLFTISDLDTTDALNRKVSRVRRGHRRFRNRRSPERERTQRAKRKELKRREAAGRMSPAQYFSATMYYATTCEDLAAPWARGATAESRQPAIDAAAAAISDDTFSPFSRETVKHKSLASTCRGWPESADTPALPVGPLPPVPTLALNGSLDVRTPLSWARQAVAGNPSATLVELPSLGHSTIGMDMSGCALSLARLFLIYGGTDGSCKRKTQRVPVARRVAFSLDKVRPLAGRCGGVGGHRCAIAKRTVTAGYLAFRDALDQLMIGGMMGGPGLFNGSWELTDMMDEEEMIDEDEEMAWVISLQGVEHVPGAFVEGRVNITDYPNISGTISVTSFTGRNYDISISGRVAHDQRGDRIRLTASSGKSRVRLSRGSGRKAGWSAAGINVARARIVYARVTGTGRGVR